MAKTTTDIIMTTQDLDRPYEVIGLVSASCIRAGDLVKDVRETVRNWFGGEMKQYGKLLDRAIEDATERLKKKAAEEGAHAVIGVRMATSNVVIGGAEIIAYGTAVRFKDHPHS